MTLLLMDAARFLWLCGHNPRGEVRGQTTFRLLLRRRHSLPCVADGKIGYKMAL